MCLGSTCCDAKLATNRRYSLASDSFDGSRPHDTARSFSGFDRDGHPLDARYEFAAFTNVTTSIPCRAAIIEITGYDSRLHMNRIALIVAGSYAGIVLVLFGTALATSDEFGYSFLPALYATAPLSMLLGRRVGLLFAILAGALVNVDYLPDLDPAGHP